MGVTYLAHFSYRRRPPYRINLQLVLNTAYRYHLSTDVRYSLAIKTKYLAVA